MNEQIEIRQIITTILKQWKWLFIIVLICMAISFGISLALPQVYEASVILGVSRSIRAQDLNRDDIAAGDLLIQSYATLARRQPVLEGVVKELELDRDWQQLRGRVYPNVIENTQLIEITVEAESAETAELIANELAQQMISLSLSSSATQENQQSYIFAQQQLEVIRTRIDNGQERLANLSQQLLESNSTNRLNDIQDEITSLERLITDWERTYVDLLAIIEHNQSPNQLTFIQQAQAKPNPIRPRISLNSIIGGFTGMVLGVGIVLIRENYSETIESTKEIEQFLEIGSLGAVGKLRGRKYPDKLITEQSLLSLSADSYRLIHNNIEFLTSESPIHTILITSPGSGEGKSITVANLGIIMAHANLKTVIVDADLRSPTQHQIFQIPNTGGLTELLSLPETSLQDYIKNTHLERLHLINSGDVSPTSIELLRSPQMKQLLSELTSFADVILLDSPSIIEFADGLLLSKIVEGVVLVVDSDQTHRDLAQRAILNLNMAGADILGVVLNRANQI